MERNATPIPLFRARIPSGAPTSTNTIHAAGMENFFWISTSRLLILLSSASTSIWRIWIRSIVTGLMKRRGGLPEGSAAGGRIGEMARRTFRKNPQTPRGGCLGTSDQRRDAGAVPEAKQQQEDKGATQEEHRDKGACDDAREGPERQEDCAQKGRGEENDAAQESDAPSSRESEERCRGLSRPFLVDDARSGPRSRRPVG